MCFVCQLSDNDLGKNIFKDLKNLMQLNLAHNVLKKMPSGVPSSLIQLFLDRNLIDDIPKQVHSAHTVNESTLHALLHACGRET